MIYLCFSCIGVRLQRNFLYKLPPVVVGDEWVGDVKSVINIIKMAVRDDSGGMHQLDGRLWGP